MADDYGTNPESEPVDREYDRHALRTFDVLGGKLGSVVQGSGHWEDGACVARCVRAPDPETPDHRAPAPGCSCGIYGMLTLAELFRQYLAAARCIVAVISAEGTVYLGDIGLRCEAARIVAYWVAEGIEVDADQCPGARRYYDLDLMAELYGLE